MIETGNDLDFDWAIIDPSSMRTVVQAAGRVWRHRHYTGESPNVAILGRSAIVMDTGKLARPGVEFDCHPDTHVARICLDAFGERLVTDLCGRDTFNRIDAGAILGDADIPLREREQDLLSRMLATSGDNQPLGAYITHATVRLNRRMTRSRKFRRSDTRDIVYFQDAGGQDDVAMAGGAGTRHPRQYGTSGGTKRVDPARPRRTLSLISRSRCTGLGGAAGCKRARDCR